ncbi:MAG: DUF4838 domain-containing protein [Bacteroidetes bacterium]|nr:DUF4838 domain-containing protein [Bacteroidota bacterium]
MELNVLNRFKGFLSNKGVLIFGWGLGIFFIPFSIKANFITISSNGVSEYVILADAENNVSENFAASELQAYIEKITSTRLPIVHETFGRPFICVGNHKETECISVLPRYPGDDSFCVKTLGENILIRGAGQRGTLYGVYAFLERLGCWWFAPDIPVLKGHHEYIPSLPVLAIEPFETTERPLMKYRKRDADGGNRTFSPSTWPGVIDWMAKQRSNILAVSISGYEKNKVIILNEVAKRGLMLMVGQHNVMGTFLSPDKYFEEHPEWFGQIDGERVIKAKGRPVVFDTANKEAMTTFINNLIVYLKQNPEITIFQLWPPDVAYWSESSESQALGPPAERMALFVQQVTEAVRLAGIKTRIAFLGYSFYSDPPENMAFGSDALLEFCPINQNFAYPLSSQVDEVNSKYNQQLKEWIARFPGEVIHYSYYAKYSWRSLPVILPVQIGSEIKEWFQLGEKGAGMYCEPGNWLALEANHLAFSKALWDSGFDAEKWYSQYLQVRFGKASNSVKTYYELATRVSLNALIPQSATDEITDYFKLADDAEVALIEAFRTAEKDKSKWFIKRLLWQPRYLKLALQLRQAQIK